MTQPPPRLAARDLLLAAAESDEIPTSLIDALVDAVLGTPVVRMALGAREASEHRLMLALRLARAVIEADDAWTSAKAGGAR